MKRFKVGGFTLVEIIAIVIVIIVLAAIALPRIGNMSLLASRAAEDATRATVAGALERAVTDGTLTPANASNALMVITYSNSPLTRVPYLTQPTTNVLVTPTNWPGFVVTIVTNLPVNNGNNGGGNTNGPGGGSGGSGPVISGALSMQGVPWNWVDLVIVGGAISDPGVTITATTQGANGDVAISPDGLGVSYLATGAPGPDSFTFTATDANGNSTQGTVNVMTMSSYHNVCHDYAAYYLYGLAVTKWGQAWVDVGNGTPSIYQFGMSPTKASILGTLGAQPLTVAWAASHGFVIDRDLDFTVSIMYGVGGVPGYDLYQIEFTLPAQQGQWWNDGFIDDFVIPYQTN